MGGHLPGVPRGARRANGLVERRHESLDEGLERLVSVVCADDPEAVRRDLTEALVGGCAPRGHIAVVAVRREAQQPLFGAGPTRDPGHGCATSPTGLPGAHEGAAGRSADAP